MGIPIARIFGIEIRVQYSWVVVLALVAVIAVGQIEQVDPGLSDAVAWVLGAVVALGFFVSSVWHDLAHAVVARRRGVEVKSIAVSFFGGATPLDPSSPNPGDDAVIAASGPLASLALGGVFFGLMGGAVVIGGFGAVAGVLAVLGFLNIVLGLVNLVPAYPLDGGRLIRDLAWRRTGSERSGWRTAARTGRFTGWFLVLSANSVRDRVRLDDLVGGHVVSEAMDPDPLTVSPNLTVDTFAAQLLDGEIPVYAVPVVEGDSIVGLLGVGQVRRIRRSDWAKTRVEDVMAKPPKLTFLSPTEPLKQGLERIFHAGLDGLPVLEDGRLLGMLTKRGIGRFIGERSAEIKDPVPPAA